MSIRERSGKLLLIMALKTTFGFTHLHSVTGFLSPVCGDQRVRHDCSAPPGYVTSHSVKPFLFPTYTFMSPLHHMLSYLNLSLNSAAAADPTQPPDPSQLPSSAISIGDKVSDSTLSYLDLTTVLSKESPSPP